MSSSSVLRVRVRALFIVLFCVTFFGLASFWAVSQRATTRADHAAHPNGSPTSFLPDKGGITPDANAIVVNSLSDVANASDGLCTLREAITAANNDTASGAVAGECAAGSSSAPDTIDLTGLTGTLNLATALPDLNSDITISGPGANQLIVMRSTAAGTPNFRIFMIPINRTVNISGLTVSNGVVGDFHGSGGGLSNSGTTTLTAIVVSGNSGPINGGGGVFNNGTLIVRDSLITGNSTSQFGGGIYSIVGSLTVVNSTISGNSAASDGGGIFSANEGAKLTNVTISNNRCDSDGNASGAGGGLDTLGGNATLTNTLIAGNVQGTGTTSSNFDGGGGLGGTIVSSSSYNLIGVGGSSGLSNGVNNNQVGVANALLGPLANNGGPTMTHALLPGSPAIDAGNNCVLTNLCASPLPFAITTDQRGTGFNRSADGNGDGAATIDIGAFEVQSLLVTNLNDSGAGSLRQAITDANARGGTDAINFQAGLNGAINLATALPGLSTSIAINGPGASLLTVQRSTVSGTPQIRVFNIQSGAVVQLLGLTIAKGLTPDGVNGGGINNLGTLTLTNSVVSGNQTNAVGFGGGIYNTGATLTVISSTVSGNSAGASGGGIFNNGGTVALMNSTVSGNNANGPGANGGGVDNSGGTMTLTNTTVSGNGASFAGGIANDGGTQTITNSTISGNTATGQGGGVYNGGGALTLTNSTVSGNITNNSGGGIYNSSTLTLTQVTISNNRSDSANNSGAPGGGVFSSAGSLSLKNTITAGNFRGSGSTTDDISGPVNSTSSFNLIGGCSGCGLSNGTNSNQVGVSNAGLATLANNGGPTLTHALLPNSPAIDAGDNCVTQATHCSDANISQLTTDQRGAPFSRLVDGPDPDTTATVDIGASETQPSLTGIADISTNEDTSVQTAFDVGDASDVTSITASSSNTTLVPNDVAHLTVNAFGSTRVVTIVPATNANGTANITVTVNRTGGSASKTFVLIVNAVNDAPSFTKGADSTVNEDAGSQTIANWATNISPGPTDESSQTIFFQVTGNTNPALFFSLPSINSAGTLTYTPAANANGSATITVNLQDNGGAANGGVNTSAPQTFTVTITPVNDAPSFLKGANQTVGNNAGAQTVNNWATNISPGPADESSQTVAFQVTSNTNTGIFTVQPAISPTGTLTYTPNASAGGTATITINLKDNGGTANGGVDTSSSQSFTITVNAIGGSFRFASASSNTTENSGSTTITVSRTGDSSRAATVDYATNADSGLPCSTASGVASPKCDFTSALGTLSFGPGDQSKTITILISQDSFVEGPETITVTLSNQTGGSSLTSPSTTSITIADDASEPPTNIIDDPNMFVRMHYHDFLNREADQSGLDFWTGQMTNCGSSDLTVCRVNVSGAFFLSIEFQQTGYLVERMYKSAYGDATGTSTLGGSHQLPVPIVRFNEFLQDTQRIGRGVVVLAPGWEQALENNKQAYAGEFAATSRFISAFPTTMTPAQFVDKLNQNAGNVLSASERTTAINLFSGAADSSNTTARAQALRQVAEDQDLFSAEFNRAFVLTEFFGYLRRNPNDLPDSDYTGYEFWLSKLNQFNGDYIGAEMVKAFIASSEYRQRFGP